MNNLALHCANYSLKKQKSLAESTSEWVNHLKDLLRLELAHHQGCEKKGILPVLKKGES